MPRVAFDLGLTESTGVTSTAPTSLGYEDFVGMHAKLDSAYMQSASFVRNSTTPDLILGFTDTPARPLFVPSVNTNTLDKSMAMMLPSANTIRTLGLVSSALFSLVR